MHTEQQLESLPVKELVTIDRAVHGEFQSAVDRHGGIPHDFVPRLQELADEFNVFSKQESTLERLNNIPGIEILPVNAAANAECNVERLKQQRELLIRSILVQQEIAQHLVGSES